MAAQEKNYREFRLTTLALRNRNTIFLITGVIILFGIISYRSLPKELFPEIVLPTVLVQTVYPGNPPLDGQDAVLDLDVQVLLLQSGHVRDHLAELGMIGFAKTTGSRNSHMSTGVTKTRNDREMR